MAFRMVSASNREKLLRKTQNKKELTPVEEFQVEVLAETDTIDAQYPPRAHKVKLGALTIGAKVLPEVEVTPEAAEFAQQLDAQSSYDTIEAEIDATAISAQVPNAEVLSAAPELQTQPPTRKRRLSTLAQIEENKEANAPQKLMGESMRAATSKKTERDPKRPRVPKKKIITQPITLPAKESLEVTSSTREAPRSPVRQETAQAEPLNAIPIAMRVPELDEIIQNPGSTDSSRTITDVVETENRDHTDVVDLTEIATPATSPSRTKEVDLNQPAPQVDETGTEDALLLGRRNAKGKAPVDEDIGSFDKIFLDKGAHVLSGEGEPSEFGDNNAFDPSKPSDWPYDIPVNRELAMFSFAGFAGYHKYPVPPAHELKKLLDDCESYPFLTLQHPASCDERELAVLFDTATKLMLHTGQEMFHRHRHWSTQYVGAIKEGYARGRKESNDLLENATIKIIYLQKEVARIEEERKKSAEEFATSQATSQARITALEQSLSESHQELITTKAQVETLRKENASVADLAASQAASQARVATLEQSLSKSHQELDTAKNQTETLQKENAAILSRVEVIEAERVSLSQQLADRNAALTALQEEVEELKQECDLAWMNADDFADEADISLWELNISNDHHTLEKRALKGEVERLKSEIDSLEVEMAKVQEDAVEACARARMSGASDFRSCTVFKNLVARLCCPIGFQFWENCVGQTSRIGGFKDDFDPDEHLDSGLDPEFREYGDDGSLNFNETDEFAALQYDEERDQDLIPKGEAICEPKLPNYPKKAE